MGSVRGVLPRLAVFGLAVAAFVILLTVSRAGAAVAAPEPDPVGALDGAIAAALPTDPGELPLPLVLDGSEAAPSVENPEQMLSTDLAPELAPTAILLATPAPANQPGAIDAGPAPPSPLIEASDSPPAGPVLPGLTDGAVAPLADEVTRAAIAIPPVSTLPFDQDLVSELDVPSVLLSLSDHASPPTPLSDPQPADREGAFLRPATAPTIVANPSARHATAPVGESTSSFGPPAGTFATGGEPMPPDPGAGSGPARAPPNDAPSDPPHRGSTDHASHEYSALPGTDRIGDTRGESWHPGTDVEMSNTPPEPSVSPD